MTPDPFSSRELGGGSGHETMQEWEGRHAWDIMNLGLDRQRGGGKGS